VGADQVDSTRRRNQKLGLAPESAAECLDGIPALGA
jgi:hypothetical protein